MTCNAVFLKITIGFSQLHGSVSQREQLANRWPLPLVTFIPGGQNLTKGEIKKWSLANPEILGSAVTQP
jgi:hypothetical protein